MNKEKGRVPKLRFPGFTEDWEQRKLGSIGSTYTGLSGKTKEDFGHGEAKYITYLNVFQNTISNITMTDKVEIDPTQNEVKYGDVLFTTSSETPEEVGMSSVWLGDTPNIYLNSFCFGFRPNQKIDSYFLGYSLRAPYMRDKIKILAQGISRYNISKNKVMELEISLPNNEEQKLLGTFLQRIDLIITLHQRKLEHLNLKKKALLQKLFPKNGERYPELRFPGFTDAWEQRKLGNLTQLITKGTTPKVKNIQNGINFIKVENISDDGVISINSYVSEEEHMNYLSRSILANNDILFSIAGTLGRTAIVKSHLLPANTNQALAIIRLNKSVDVEYINTFLKSNAIKTYIRKNPTVGAQPNLSLGQVSDLEINIPNYSEQKKISNLFSKFDLMITLHQCKLEHLQLQKKALLQQMFV